MVTMEDEEEYFPRGGGKGMKTSLKRDRNYIFESNKPVSVKKKKLGRKERIRENAKKIVLEEAASDEENQINIEASNVLKPFSYNNLLEGTLSMCCVSAVQKTFLVVALPEKLSAVVPVNLISNKIGDTIVKVSTEKKGLEDYFCRGMCFPCKIMEASIKSNDYKVTATIDPSKVNCDIPCSSVKKGLTIVAAVDSIEDHGFVMSTGIEGVQAFLPFDNMGNYLVQINSGKQLEEGQLLWCIVVKSKMIENYNRVQLSIDPDILPNATLDVVPSIDALIPGHQVNIKITKVTPKMLYVQEISSNIDGFIPATHLESVWSNATDYKVNTEHTVTVLYRFPQVNVVCFSMYIKANSLPVAEIPSGELFNRAKVLHKDNRSICVQLEYKKELFKGEISVKRLKQTVVNEKLNDMFPLGNHVSVRLNHYHSLDRVYSCTADNQSVQHLGHSQDYKAGQRVDIEINVQNKDGFIGKVGAVNAFVPKLHGLIIKDLAKTKDNNRTYKGRVLYIDENRVKLTVTLCPELIKCKPLLNFHTVKVGESYKGVINKILPYGLVVSFFNNLYSLIQETELPKPPNHYKIGELINCYILKMLPDKKPLVGGTKQLGTPDMKAGSIHSIVVKSKSEKGLKCLVLEEKKPIVCLLKVHHLSDSIDYCPQLLKKYEVGDIIPNAILYNYNDSQVPTFTLRKSVRKFFEENPEIKESGIHGVKVGDEIPATVAYTEADKAYLDIPISGYNGKVSVKIPDKLKQHFKIHKGITVKVTKVSATEKEISVGFHTKKNAEEDGDNKNTLYNCINKLSKHFKKTPGEEINVKIVSVTDSTMEAKLPNKGKGIISKRSKKEYKEGHRLKALYLYEDSSAQVSHLCVNNLDFKKGKENGINVVHLAKDFCVGVEYSTRKVIFLNPLNMEFQNIWKEKFGIPFTYSNVMVFAKYKRTYDKFTCGHVPWNIFMKNTIRKYEIRMEKRSENVIKKKEEQIDQEDNGTTDSDEISETMEITSPSNKINETTNVEEKKLKRKMMEADDDQPKKTKKVKKTTTDNIVNGKQNTTLENNILEVQEQSQSPELKRKKSTAANMLKLKKFKEIENLSLDVGTFKWDATPEDLAKTVAMEKLESANEESSDEEVVIKKKLTPAEKKAAKMEEERLIREKEEELLNCDENPQSADHFDRLVMANPNDSKIWIQYMAFHLQNTDIDRARSIGRRALKHINVQLEQEKLNVWGALLNVEDLYGTTEGFESTVKEALKYNDDYKVNMKLLVIYRDSKKIPELDKLTNHLVRKYKNKLECWLECQSSLMQVGLTDKARNFLQRALSCLPTTEHITLISRFALLENKYGFHGQAQSLFDNLLTSYPQRIDIWNVYVDMLVKNSSTDLARGVLERISSHKLPVRKMRAIYKKWLQFEETYGTKKSVQNVRQAAEKYVKDLTPKLKKVSDENSDDDDDDNNSEPTNEPSEAEEENDDECSDDDENSDDDEEENDDN